MRPNRTAGITGPASKIAGLPGRIYNPPLQAAFDEGACGAGGHKARPYTRFPYGKTHAYFNPTRRLSQET